MIYWIVSVAFPENLFTSLIKASKSNLKVREEKSKGIWVEGATEIYVSSEQDVLDVIRVGGQNRAIAATSMCFISASSNLL